MKHIQIVDITGGLGNQMFQYAFALALQHRAKPNHETRICSRSLRGYSKHNGYELKRIFGVTIPEASLFSIMRVCHPFFDFFSWRLIQKITPPSRQWFTRRNVGVSTVKF